MASLGFLVLTWLLVIRLITCESDPQLELLERFLGISKYREAPKVTAPDFMLELYEKMRSTRPSELDFHSVHSYYHSGEDASNHPLQAVYRYSIRHDNQSKPHQAELRLFHHGSEHDRTHEVSLYLSHGPMKRTLLESRTVPRGTPSQWLVFDVSSLLESRPNNLAFMVSQTKDGPVRLRRSADSSSEFTDAEASAADHSLHSLSDFSDSWNQQRPYLLVYNRNHLAHSSALLTRSKRQAVVPDLSSNPVAAPSTSALNVKRKQRKGKRRKKRKNCRRRKWRVRFEDLHWENWIITPREFNAFFCRGKCRFPLNDKQQVTNHAVVQSLISSISTRVPEPCCVPTELSPISMLYREDGRAVLKMYEDMVVENCGCR